MSLEGRTPPPHPEGRLQLWDLLSTGRVSHNRLRPSAQRLSTGLYTECGAGEVHFDGSLHSEARQVGGASAWETDAMRRGIDNIQETPEKTATCV